MTLLALGNGAPDIFSAFAAINQEDDRKASLAVGALFGKNLYAPFTLPAPPLTPSPSQTLPFHRCRHVCYNHRGWGGHYFQAIYAHSTSVPQRPHLLHGSCLLDLLPPVEWLGRYWQRSRWRSVCVCVCVC